MNGVQTVDVDQLGTTDSSNFLSALSKLMNYDAGFLALKCLSDEKH